MTTSRRLAIGAGFLALAGAATAFFGHGARHYLPDDTAAFVATFSAPPAADSPETRRELDELLDLQARRTAAETAAAQADAKKDVSRFYAALGFDPAKTPRLPRLQALTDDVEADVS